MTDTKGEPPEDGWILGKDRRLKVLSAQPLVLETPIELLAGQRVVPTERLFVRNIRDLPGALDLQPRPVGGWGVELTGLIAPARVVVRGEDLVGMAQVEHEMVLQCSGNGRTRFAGIPGTPWTQGGMANVRFSGVPLSAVLERHGVALQRGARYVTAVGLEPDPGQARPIEHSLPVADVLDRSFLALELDGAPLPAIHGGPVRLVTPGLFGTMQIKWLTRLRFEADESTSYYHATEYRVPLQPAAPGEPFEFTLENSRPTWRLKLLSAILDPAPGTTVAAGQVTVSGVAYNDGSARVDSVLISADHGASWLPAALEVPDSPYAWYPWTVGLDLAPGTHEIWSRAVDDRGETQPLDGMVAWNPNGYEWAGTGRTTLTVR